jgi:hypothetical protein
MPLTNALNDSDYVAELTDVEFLRILGKDLWRSHPNMWQPTKDRLNEIADRLSEPERVPSDFRGEGHEVNSRLAPTDPQIECHGFDLRTLGNPLADHLSQDELDSVEDAMTGTLVLTPEMSLPPDFDLTDPVQLFNAHNDRDLVAEVRQEIKNAHANGFNPLSRMDDMDVAGEIQNHTDAYDNVHIDTLAEAVARVRADPSDGMYNA